MPACTIAAMLGFGLTPAPVSAMTMRVANDQVILSGRLVPGDAADFQSLLDANPGVKTVVFWNSPGGAAIANRAISRMIADRKLATAIAGYCVSACAMMFLSGVTRNFSDGEALDATSLGYHGNYLAGGVLNQEPRLQQLKRTVLEETGGKADPALVDRWLHLADQRNTVRFRYPGTDKSTKVTVFQCSGGGPNRGDYAGCAPIAGVDALTMGIITSTEIVHVQK